MLSTHRDAIDVIQTVAAGFAALGTTGAVVWAIWGERLRARRTRPRLTIANFDPASADAVELNASAWARLRVCNRPHTRPAEDVEVLIERVDVLTSATDERQKALAYSPAPLGSLADRALKWADRASPTVKIPPDATRRIDLLHIDQPPGGQGTPTELKLTFWDEPQDGRHRLPGLEYAITLAIEGRNIDRLKYGVTVSFDGQWLNGHAIWGSVKLGPVKPIKTK